MNSASKSTLGLFSSVASTALLAKGAVPRLVGVRLGVIDSTAGPLARGTT